MGFVFRPKSRFARDQGSEPRSDNSLLEIAVDINCRRHEMSMGVYQKGLAAHRSKGTHRQDEIIEAASDGSCQ